MYMIYDCDGGPVGIITEEGAQSTTILEYLKEWFTIVKVERLAD